MKLPSRVLLVGAHCDDIELFAGGLLAELCFRGEHQLGVLVFSDHRGVVSEATAQRSREEMQANLAWLSEESGCEISDHSEWLLPACRGAFEAERGRIYARLEELRPHYDAVITHAPDDTNQDHQQVAKEASRVFKGHATVLGGEFPANDLGDFRPQLYLPLCPEALDAKVKMVGRYHSQQFGGRPYFSEASIRGLAAVRGSQIREAAAEALCVNTRIIVS